MFRFTPITWTKGQYKTRLKTRMVGYMEKVVHRKVRNCIVAMRSEANTGAFIVYTKKESEMIDQTGKKIQQIRFDQSLGRMTLFKEAKLKGPFMLKSHVVNQIS
eukprot:PhF_6_TR6463/c0_g1_i1/m.9670